MNPILRKKILSVNGRTFPPAPPYIVAGANNHAVNMISGLSYLEGSGPSGQSSAFNIQALGLTPSSGNITITPSSNIEISDDNGSTWMGSPILLPYTSGKIHTLNVYVTRLKSGLTPNTYNETITLSGANASDFIIYVTGSVIAISYLVATGGSMTQVGNRKVHVFNSTADFEITSLSNNPSYNSLRVLVVAGAGGGGGFDGVASGNSCPCGGAGGGVKEVNSYSVFSTGIISAIVGIGGIGGFNGVFQYPGDNGTDSTFDVITTIGGGFGAGSISSIAGGNGGCGGGSMSGFTGGLGTIGQGKDGGTASPNVPNYGGAGGGGAIQAGQDGTNTSGGNGGDGLISDITGSNIAYGSGGGGGVYVGGTPGLGGLDGGGDAGQPTLGLTNGISGNANRGAGGGSASHPGISTGTVNNGGDGSDGVIIVSYISP